MRVYLAAASELQLRMKFLRSAFLQNGVEVTSHWLDVDLRTPYTPVGMQLACEMDLKDIEECEAFIAYNPSIMHKKGTGGRHVEFGYALARNKPIIYVGEKTENVYHYSGGIILVQFAREDMGDLCALLLKPLKEIEDAQLRQGTRTI